MPCRFCCVLLIDSQDWTRSEWFIMLVTAVDCSKVRVKRFFSVIRAEILLCSLLCLTWEQCRSGLKHCLRIQYNCINCLLEQSFWSIDHKIVFQHWLVKRYVHRIRWLHVKALWENSLEILKWMKHPERSTDLYRKHCCAWFANRSWASMCAELGYR